MEFFASAVTVITAMVTLFIYFHRRMKQVMFLLEDWAGYPPRPGVPGRPGVMERLEAIENKVNSTDYNTKPNSGSSAYDHQMKVLNEIKEMINNGKI